MLLPIEKEKKITTDVATEKGRKKMRKMKSDMMKESIEPPKPKPIKKKKKKPNTTEVWEEEKRKRTGDFWTQTHVKPKVTATVLKKPKVYKGSENKGSGSQRRRT